MKRRGKIMTCLAMKMSIGRSFNLKLLSFVKTLIQMIFSKCFSKISKGVGLKIYSSAFKEVWMEEVDTKIVWEICLAIYLMMQTMEEEEEATKKW